MSHTQTSVLCPICEKIMDVFSYYQCIDCKLIILFSNEYEYEYQIDGKTYNQDQFDHYLKMKAFS